MEAGKRLGVDLARRSGVPRRDRAKQGDSLLLVRRWIGAVGPEARGHGVGTEHTVSVTLNGTAVGGRVAPTGVGPTTLATPGPFSAGGDLEADNIAQSALDLSQASVGGSAYLRTRDAASIDISSAALGCPCHGVTRNT